MDEELLQNIESSDKYYVPTREEFHIGFEYYYLLQGGTQENGCSPSVGWDIGWTKRTIVKNYMIPENNIDGFYRVKYLDSEDIESLGFKKIINDQYYFEDNDFECTLLIDSDMFVQIIIDGGYLFQGTIKNKSELARLLKQLNITK